MKRRDFLKYSAALGIGTASLGGLLSACSTENTGETEIEESGDTVKLLSPDGTEGILSHVNIGSPFRVGKYGIDIKVKSKAI